ncbi:Malectin [Parasponia andersonii]|uniref:non-specific serine/threonine protein kinase n=1 Tax=Parasponia andersonii TaxID=3476 RepID=A0A2P5APT5_PARAD|nr:Malectin [Parasponia andersonii]
MKSLTVLVLRNNNITGSIPSNIGEYHKLTQLDLSFNKINGQIPESLFNMSSLSLLFLGNNSLSGTLPQQKSTSLLVIDVSYNNLMGTLPPWIGQENLQLNLVGGNYFKIKSSESRFLPSGLNCLQQNFPCNRGKGIYYNFGINCAGPEIRPSNGILYERDNETLGPATYYVTSTKRWAVSNVGSFTGNSEPHYTSELAIFQTARLSASSLRYYGLGLENGVYNIDLQFAETAFLQSASWKSNGRRIFDIYIQGKLVYKDFDMRKEAGGVFPQSVQKPFKVQVSENYIEIHLFWAGKGTCCIHMQGTYGPSISAISASPDFIPTVSNKPPTEKKRTDLIVGISVGVGILSILSVLGIFYNFQRRKKSQTNNDEEKKNIDLFCLRKRKDMGTLDDGRVVAIKQLSVTSHQGKNQFVAEIATISAVQHRNLAWNLHQQKHEVELVDSGLSSEFDEEEVKRVVEVALLCTQRSPSFRPPMSRVVAMLLGDVEVNKEISRPGYFADSNFNDVSITSSVTGNTDHYYAQTSTKSPTSPTRPMLLQGL